MRLSEIIDPEIKDAEGPSLLNSGNPNEYWKNKLQLGKRLGTGYFAAAWTHASDPGVIIKIEKNPSTPKYNSYYRYIENVKTQMASNPFLPRVYDIEKINYAALTQHVYVIERLHHADSLLDRGLLTRDHIMGMIDRYLILNKDSRYEVEDMESEELWEWFSNKIADISKYGNGSVRTPTKDTKLTQACDMVNDLTHSGSFVDIHEDNIMLRLTSVGPQVVITDPLS
jgi:hypothetical protein